MTPMQRFVHERGGLAAAHEIPAGCAVAARSITVATEARELERVRQGWYSTPWLPVAEKRAARIGGQLACVSAASSLGLWDPVVNETHVRVPRNAARLRSPSASRTRLRVDHPVHVHWTGLDETGSRTLVSPAGCIRQVAECARPEVALAVAESALHRGAMSAGEWEAALAGFPRPVRRLLNRAGWGSESGTESVFAYRMALAGVVVRQQVWIEGVGRVDGLVGERLVIELDSRAFHPDAEADARRDAALSALGYRVLRFWYAQVMHDWPSVLAAVLAAIERGDHLAPFGAGIAGAASIPASLE